MSVLFLSQTKNLRRMQRLCSAVCHFPNTKLQYGEGNSEINSPHQLVLNKSIHNGMVTGISNSSIVPYANLFKTHTRNYGKKYEDSDDEDDYDLEKGLDFADKLFTVASLRIDACAKAAFKMSRNQAEKEIYASKFRFNGERLEKRGITVRVDDVLEYVKQNPSRESPNLMEIARAEVRHIGGFESSKTNYKLVLRIYPKFLVPHWD